MSKSPRRAPRPRWLAVASGTIAAAMVVAVAPLSAHAAAPNVALGKAATADSGAGTASSGNDGSTYTAWRADDPGNGHYYQVDLGASYNLSGSEVTFEAPYLEKYRVQVSSDGSTWSTVVDKTNNTDSSQTQTDSFTASATRYVRITLTSVQPGTWASIYEFRVFGLAASAGGGGGTTPTPTPPPTVTPTTPPSGPVYGSNLAVGKTATADSGAGTASSGNDDSIYTEWRADDSSNGHYYQVDLGAPYSLSGSEVMFEAPYLEKYKVQVSNDGSTWTTAVDKTNNTDNSQTQTDAFTTSGRYARITLTAVQPGTWAGIYEFRVFGAGSGGGGTTPPATAPGAFSQSAPANGATGVSTAPVLSWGAASGATSYSVVASTDSSYSSPIVNASGLTSTSYSVPTALANSAHYYWKVTATNSAGSTVASNAGLSFTTAAGSGSTGGGNAAAEYYVDPANGNDANSGSLASPLRTLDRARTVVNGVKGDAKSDITIYLRGGTYALTSPFVLGAGDSGVNGHSIVYTAYNGEQPVISGGEQITGWTVDKTIGANTIYKANAHGLNFGQLYVNNSPATVARTPNLGTENAVTGWNVSAGSPQVNTSEVPAFTNHADNPARIKLQLRWIDASLPIASLSSAGGTTTVTPTDPARQPATNMQPGVQTAGNPYHFENAYEFLDAPGEWYLDKASDTVYYVAPAGQSMSTTKVVAPKLEELVRFVGTVGNPVHDITFSDITVQDTTWLAPITDGFFWGSWSSFPGWVAAKQHRPLSAVLVQDGQHITLTRDTVRDTGGDGIFVRESQNINIVGNQIYDIGYHGVELGMFQDYDSDVYPGVDYEHGTPTDSRYIEKDDTISNNYITRVGQTYLDGIGIKIGWASNTAIEHNTITDVPYSGMMLGNGKPYNQSPLGNLLVAYNDVSRNNTLLSDGAAIYAYALHNPKTTIEDNYLHDGYFSQYEDNSNILGLYFDDGARGFIVTDNVISNEASGEINGGEGEHIALGDVFTNNQSTDQAFINRVIANAGQEPAYR